MKNDYQSMPREELIAELKVWQNKLDKEVSKRLGEITLERQKEIDDRIEFIATMTAADMLSNVKSLILKVDSLYDVLSYDMINSKQKMLVWISSKAKQKLGFDTVYHYKKLKEALAKEHPNE